MLPCPHCGGPLVLSAPDAQPAPAPPVQDLQQRQQVLRQYLDVVRSTDVHTAAAHLFRTGEPSPAQVQSARRALDRLVRDGALTRTGGAAGGWNGGRLSVYTLPG